jgi:pilus assembly protein Flp/PilA
MKNFARFFKDESGATAIEYALLAGLIGVGVVAAADTLGTEITALFGRVETELKGAVK